MFFLAAYGAWFRFKHLFTLMVLTIIVELKIQLHRFRSDYFLRFELIIAHEIQFLFLHMPAPTFITC